MMFVFWSKRFLIGWSQYDFIAEWFWIYINFFLEIWKCLTLLLLFFISTNTLWSGARDYIIIVCLFLFMIGTVFDWLMEICLHDLMVLNIQLFLEMVKCLISLLFFFSVSTYTSWSGARVYIKIVYFCLLIW